MLVRLANGRLPWEGVPKRTRAEIGRMKQTLTGAQTALGVETGAIAALIDISKALPIDECPPYDALRGEFVRSISQLEPALRDDVSAA